mmetsp:Transcript_4840/g.9643  ORF Transcript_4840/g.9643 Transcript_4840/m.9643 type:complete len:209 (-) Transcript_4840:14-640(-)
MDLLTPSSSHKGFAFVDALIARSRSMFSLSRTFSSNNSSSFSTSVPASFKIPLSANVRIISPSSSNASNECPFTFAFFKSRSDSSSFIDSAASPRGLFFARDSTEGFAARVFSTHCITSSTSSPSSPSVFSFSIRPHRAFETRCRKSSAASVPFSSTTCCLVSFFFAAGASSTRNGASPNDARNLFVSSMDNSSCSKDDLSSFLFRPI